MRSRWIWIAILLGLAWPRSALANMARSYWSGETHGPLMAQGPTSVRVDAEDLTFVLAAELDSAEVTARYRMTNAGAEPSGGDVAFVFVHGDDDRYRGHEGSPAPVITIDGAAAAFRTVDGADLPARGRGSWSDIPSERLTWLVFRLDFAAGQSRTVEVRYRHRPDLDLAARVNPTMTYEYLLSPARSWASFGPLRLRVQLPADAELLSSTVPLARDGGGYRAELAGLPDGELTFAVTSTRGLWLGLTSPSSYFGLLGLALALVTVPAAWLLGRRWRRARPLTATARMVIGIGLLVMALASAVMWIAGEVFPPRAFGFGYGGSFLLIGFWLLTVLGGLIVAAIAAMRPAD